MMAMAPSNPAWRWSTALEWQRTSGAPIFLGTEFESERPPWPRIERTLAQSEPDEDSLAALQKSLQQEDRDPFFLEWLRNERATLHARLEALQTGKTKL